ncbi:MAG: hypothetical protein ABIJ21_06560 [Nanoarchaeota archaeon]
MKQLLEEITKEEKSIDIPIADLVMMQMAGDFDHFLAEVAKPDVEEEELDQLIEETRESTTAHKLYPKIVERTIESQFGEQHTTLRELGQNAIDSYDARSTDRRVIFSLEEQPEHLVLHVRDYGCGMDLKTLVRDLIIPYNSGKEFDPTKIGEHGIGWYSIVDFADLVKVVTRTPGRENVAQAYVYSEDGTWMARFIPQSMNGFHPPLNTREQGTEVTAFIPTHKTSRQQIKDALYQHLGMVDEAAADITFDDDQINTLRSTYSKSSPVLITLDDVTKLMTLGVSKRELAGRFTDPRFKYRNQNLNKILFTQRGLFIKYDNADFSDQSIHRTLLNSLTDIGLDFWVDVPDHVTLTKGRNNIIADHSPAVLDGIYAGFEELFLDVILADEEIVYHSSGSLMQTLSDIFTKRYNNQVYAARQKEYTFKRRMGTYLAKGISATLDGATVAAKLPFRILYLGGYSIYKTVTYPFTDLPNDISEAIAKWKADAPNRKERRRLAREKNLADLAYLGHRISHRAKQAAPYVIGAGALGFGLYETVKHWGWKPLEYVGKGLVLAAATGLAGYGIYRLAKAIPGCIDDLVDYFSRIKLARENREQMKSKRQKSNRRNDTEHHSLSDLVTTIYHALPAIGSALVHIPVNIYDGLHYLGQRALHGLGLYVNVEEKRTRKMNKQREKITKKYLSNMRKDAFFQKIMEKKIINATYFYREQKEKPVTGTIGEEAEKKSILERFEEALWGEQWSQRFDYDRSQGSRDKDASLKKQTVKLSIDDLVDLYLRRKLITGGCPSHDEYVVDKTNPIVEAVMSRLEEIKYKVGSTYDVKILEDHLDNLKKKAKGLASVLYYLSPIGMAHIGIYLIKETREGFRDGAPTQIDELRRSYSPGKYYAYRFVQYLQNTPERVHHWAKTKGRKIAKYSGIALISPAIALYYGGKGAGLAGKWTYTNGLLPLVQVLDPRDIPQTIEKINAWYHRHQEQATKKKEKRANRKKYKKERDEQDRIAKELENRRQREAQELERARKAEVKALLRAEQHKNRKNKWNNFLANIKDWYYNSVVYNFLGDGIRSGDSFDDMPLDRLDKMLSTVDCGRTLRDYVHAIESLDSLLSEAIRTEPHRIQLAYNDVTLVSQPSHIGITSKKKGVWTIHLNNLHTPLKQLDKAYATGSKNRIDAVALTLLDRMLHIYAHEAIGTDESFRLGDTFCDAEKIEGLYRKKQELRWKIMDYMEQQGLNLQERIGLSLHKREPYDYFDLRYLNQLAHMTLRRLYEEEQRVRELKKQDIAFDARPKENNVPGVCVANKRYEEHYPIIKPKPAPPPPQQTQNPVAWNA